jgi:hypothetical protein
MFEPKQCEKTNEFLQMFPTIDNDDRIKPKKHDWPSLALCDQLPRKTSLRIIDIYFFLSNFPFSTPFLLNNTTCLRAHASLIISVRDCNQPIYGFPSEFSSYEIYYQLQHSAACKGLMAKNRMPQSGLHTVCL